MDQYEKLADLEPLIRELRERAKGTDAQTRFEIMKLSQELALEAETVSECITRVSFGSLEPSLAIIGCETDIFKQIANAKSPITSAELAKVVKIEPKLLSRYTRALAAYGLLREAGPGSYEANKTTHAFTTEAAELALKHMAHNVGPALISMPDWLSTQDPHKEVSVNDLSFHKAHGTDKSSYQWLSSPGQESNMRYVAGFMSTLNDDHLTWYDVFPVLEEAANISIDQPLFVDVGGSLGHRTQEFQRKFHNLKGRLIVQDLPNVVATSPDLDGIEFVSLDALTSQPISGAKFYYMRYLLHDYPDDECIGILKNIQGVMAKNSVLLIDEVVLADINNHPIAADWDMTMLVMFGSHERTLEMWEKIADSAGFRIKMCQVYKPAARNAIIALEAKK